jgi:hypothetical protein
MKRSGPIIWQHAPVSVYQDVVDQNLQAQFGKTARELYADTVVIAAQRVGMTPGECIAWLAEVDGL